MEEDQSKQADAPVTDPAATDSHKEGLSKEEPPVAKSPPKVKKESFLQFFKKSNTKTKVRLVAAIFAGIIGLYFGLSSIKRIASIPGYLAALNAPSEHVEHATPDVAPFTYTYEMRPVSVQINDKTGLKTSYIQYSILFDCADKKCIRNLTISRAMLRNLIFEVTSGFGIVDFQPGQKGIVRYKQALLERLQTEFGELAPRNLAIENWTWN